MGDLVLVLKKDFKIGSISTLRLQLHSHLLVLNWIKSELSLLISGRSHHTIMQQLSELRMEVQAIQTVQRSGTVLPTSENIAKQVARQLKQEVEPQPFSSEHAAGRHDQLPDTPLNDGRSQTVSAQPRTEVSDKAQQSPRTQRTQSKVTSESVQEPRTPIVTRPARRSFWESTKRRFEGTFYVPPLQTAIINDNLEAFRALLAGGADVNELSGHGLTAISTACNSRRSLEFLEALIDAGAN